MCPLSHNIIVHPPFPLYVPPKIIKKWGVKHEWPLHTFSLYSHIGPTLGPKPMNFTIFGRGIPAHYNNVPSFSSEYSVVEKRFQFKFASIFTVFA